MLAAREGLHPALVDLLVDAAHEIHGEQGFFQEAGEFPGMTKVDLRVSTVAERHKRFGPSFLYRYLPFWMATMAERAIIILLRLPWSSSQPSTICHSFYAGGSAPVSIRNAMSPCALVRCQQRSG